MKICIIISLLVSKVVTEPSFLRCSYIVKYNTYGCDLTINNPNGLNNFTEIGGVHLEEFANSDVAEIRVVDGTNSVSTNVPSIICDTFTNLLRLKLCDIWLTEIGDNDFGSCSQITLLDLSSNSIKSISTNAFLRLPRLYRINLDRNNLTALPENIFAHQQNLTVLDISSNPLEDIPVGLFRPLEKLEWLFLSNASINEVKSEWFGNKRLDTLWLSSNRITALPDTFIGLEELQDVVFSSNEISEIRSRGFIGLTKLENLSVDRNKLIELKADTFLGLGKLLYLYLDHNPIEVINGRAFRGLDNLITLNMEACRIRQIQSNYFVNLRGLTSIALYNNEIEELPEGVFGTLQLQRISLSNNHLKILHRNSFGSLRNLDLFDVSFNNVTAFDRAIIDDAVDLKHIFFSNNLCASFIFVANRTQLLPMLEECFDNYKKIIDDTTTTDTSTKGKEDNKLPVYQIFQNVRYKEAFGFSFKYMFLFYSILSFSVLFYVLVTIYLLTNCQ